MIEIDRKTFLQVCRMSERLASTSPSRMPYISEWHVKATMPANAMARVGNGFGGGDEELTFVRWEWMTAEDRTLSGYTIIPRVRLYQLEAKSRLDARAKGDQDLRSASQQIAGCIR